MKQIILNVLLIVVLVASMAWRVSVAPDKPNNFYRRVVRAELQEFNRNAIKEYQDSVATVVYEFLDKLYESDEYLYEDVISQWEETDRLYEILAR